MQLSDNSCLKFFQRDWPDKKQIGPELRKLSSSELDHWESLTASSVSPKPVENSEKIWRQILDPTHWDRIKKAFTPIAFQDAETFGLSVNRFAHTNLEQLVQAAETRVAKWNAENAERPSRRFIAFAIFDSGYLRGLPLTENGTERLLYVFDTANADDTSHADVFRLGGAEEKQASRRARSFLYEIGMKALHDRNGHPVSPEEIATLIGS